jgi:hypothetical protein
MAAFDRRVDALRLRHAKKPSFIGRIDHVTSTPGS